MKKTGFVWFILIVGMLNFVLGFVSMLGSISTWFSSTVTTVDTLFGVVSLIIWAIYLYKLFVMKNDIVKWTNITFGFDVFMIAFSTFLLEKITQDIVIFNLMISMIWIILWLLAYSHLKKIASKVV